MPEIGIFDRHNMIARFQQQIVRQIPAQSVSHQPAVDDQADAAGHLRDMPHEQRVHGTLRYMQPPDPVGIEPVGRNAVKVVITVMDVDMRNLFAR